MTTDPFSNLQTSGKDMMFVQPVTIKQKTYFTIDYQTCQRDASWGQNCSFSLESSHDHRYIRASADPSS